MSAAGELVNALRAAGMADVPDRFGVAPVHQEIPARVLAEIDEFVAAFDRVTGRAAWQEHATARSPAIARSSRPERCCFSAWDFHLSPHRSDAWQLIEFNDNGSGLLFAALLNHHHYRLSGLAAGGELQAPLDPASFAAHLVGMMRAEAEDFFGEPARDLLLILDDAGSLETGRFRDELSELGRICRAAGWRAEIASPGSTTWDGARLLCRGAPVRFIVNRSTDFFWEGDEFSALRSAYAERRVYVAPNPFTYATRSDKQLLEWLSSSESDRELGIEPEERELLRAHVPETRVLREDNVDELALTSNEWYFKPSHGFASHGLLPGQEVGRTRLRRLLKKGPAYVAQRAAPKLRLETDEGVSLWTDLRIWAYRGQRFLLSGRASRRPDRLDLTPPGGWIATYARGR